MTTRLTKRAFQVVDRVPTFAEPTTGMEQGSWERMPSDGKHAGRRAAAFDPSLSWQLDAALYLEEHVGGRLERWLARRLRRRLEARLPGRGR